MALTLSSHLLLTCRAVALPSPPCAVLQELDDAKFGADGRPLVRRTDAVEEEVSSSEDESDESDGLSAVSPQAGSGAAMRRIAGKLSEKLSEERKLAKKLSGSIKAPKLAKKLSKKIINSPKALIGSAKPVCNVGVCVCLVVWGRIGQASVRVLMALCLFAPASSSCSRSRCMLWLHFVLTRRAIVSLSLPSPAPAPRCDPGCLMVPPRTACAHSHGP